MPFYFAPRSPMLYVNHQGGVDGHDDGQEAIVHMVSCVEAFERNGEFVITDGHPVSPLSSQFDSLAGLDSVDWAIMTEKYWSDTDADGDRKRRRQAEFLVHKAVPFDAVRLIGAMSERVAHRAEEALTSMAHTPAIVVRQDWYY